MFFDLFVRFSFLLKELEKIKGKETTSLKKSENIYK